MEANFQRSLAVTLQYEGGWSDNPADPGGATMKGVTIGTYRRRHPNATKADLRAISDAELSAIYCAEYWNPIGGNSLASGVDLATFDAAVNSGPGRANGWLKASLGGSGAETVKRICAKRLGFMEGLKIWKNFGKGWARRVAAIEAKGVAWATSMPGNAAVVKKTLENEAAQANKKADRHVAVGTGGGAIGVGAPTISADHTVALLCILAVVLIAGVLVWRAHIHRERAAAYAAEAAAQ
ncbi:secretion activator protein [Mesorhizobium sp. M2D.F.Ca.ET.145.01.1.1]|uniref:glycoside hydrolase family 108 protein n=1 Tax=unclassified Mesorhizobium TaxID=325217 RepID=UPI000FCAAF78|nr:MULTISPECIES: glycosyl hydrolase 108 family protein [unclassified Mesorhizobium]TGU44619.1 secretion activator protein [bacterium M00.F.Ca.ET.146.01.1.1]TGU58447.1 secretion activator protein [Mesorhizobium sp. M2D.F.Ca.ET.148.01.1.1]TGU64379.1 secretion activator protein [Mesorhizobium sp. M2D.F.Ca.ET.147.01.1.1]TGW09955.1 secretion activator protein [Mesorhizobium sp. M2D.F.Ca.ET.145.01.1.1]